MFMSVNSVESTVSLTFSFILFFLINVDFWFVFVSPPSLCTDCMWAGLVFGF